MGICCLEGNYSSEGKVKPFLRFLRGLVVVDRVMHYPDLPSGIKTNKTKQKPHKTQNLFYQLLDSPKCQLFAEENCLSQDHALSRINLHPMTDHREGRKAWAPGSAWENSEGHSQVQGSLCKNFLVPAFWLSVCCPVLPPPIHLC